MTNTTVYEGFEELEEHGYVSEYVTFKGGVCRPALSLEDCEDFYPRGTKVKFINRNGYDAERERANEIIGTEQTLTVFRCLIGHSRSNYVFDEIKGEWNTVMFEKIDG